MDPKTVDELVKEARTWAALIGTEPKGARDLFSRLADALEMSATELRKSRD